MLCHMTLRKRSMRVTDALKRAASEAGLILWAVPLVVPLASVR